MSYLNSQIKKVLDVCWLTNLSVLLVFLSIFGLSTLEIKTINKSIDQLKVQLDSLKQPIIYQITDTVYQVTATCYNACKSQCDDNYLTTANGSKIESTHTAYKHRYLAVSRDLLKVFPYDCYVEVSGTDRYDGIWKVTDTMNERYQRYIDFLVNPDMFMHKWNSVYIKRIYNESTISEIS